MPFQGYLHDMSFLTGQWDCLLPLTDSPTKLTPNSHIEPKNDDDHNLSESTVETITASEAETLSLSTSCVDFTNTSLLNTPLLLPSKQSCDGKIVSNMEPSTQHPQSILQITDSTLRNPETCLTARPATLIGLEEAQGEQADIRRQPPAATSSSPVNTVPIYTWSARVNFELLPCSASRILSPYR